MYRLSVETLLGLQLEADHLRIAPCIPGHWEAYKIHYRYRETQYHISVRRAAGDTGQVIRVTLDGEVVDGSGSDGSRVGRAVPLQGMIPLMDDHCEHQVEVDLG